MVINKKGWIRITEAIFAIMLMSSVLLVVYNDKTVQVSDSQRIVSLERDILDRIASNYTLRNATMEGDVEIINKFVNSSLADYFGFGFLICNLSERCEPKSLPMNIKEFFSEERIIGSSLEKYEPKKIVLVVWKGAVDFSFEKDFSRLIDGSSCTADSNCSSGYCNGTGICKTKDLWYLDGDCDGYRNTLDPISSEYRPFVSDFSGCINTTGQVSGIDVKMDCADDNASKNAGNPGSCDIISAIWYFDADCDGYGNGSSIDAPVRPSFICSNTSTERINIATVDCNDTNYLLWKNLTGYRDLDGDGYGSESALTLCTNGTLPPNYVSIGGDFNDTNPSCWTEISCTLGVLSNNLIAYWPFDDSNLSDEISDVEAGFYDNTTSTNATFVNDRKGNVNASVRFDGLNDWINTSLNINSSEMKTISFWAKFSDFVNGQEIVSKSVSGNGIEVIIYGTKLAYYLMNGTSTTYLEVDKASINDSNWHFVTATYNYPGNMSLYVDGSSKATKTLANLPTNLNVPIYFGSWSQTLPYSYGGKRYFNGSLDEVMIFNRTLSSSEVLTLYNALK